MKTLISICITLLSLNVFAYTTCTTVGNTVFCTEDGTPTQTCNYINGTLYCY
jgi:hypothetical protein